ncbi:PTS fructose transporter subunit IIA [Streptacidiphilus neutrinimicus]|uniref:PTS fructose transporter subunit IIA n=1 Tax=Streptacidiphilus neutrinimicus TaxID=105420 RepID=UPI000A6B93A4
MSVEDGKADVVPLRPQAGEDGGAPARTPLRVLTLPDRDRVGIVLVCRSRALAQATLDECVRLLPGADPAPVAAVGVAAEGVVAAARQVDQGIGVAVLCDLPETAEAVLALLDRAEELALPFPIRFCDAPLIEGAVPAVATATAGGDLAAVAEAAEDAYRVRKTPPHHPPHLLGN